jgi:signal transduction histidine kinase
MTRLSKYLEKRIVCLLFCLALTVAGNAQSSVAGNAQSHPPESIVSPDLNIAITYIDSRQYDKALPYLQKADSLATRAGSPQLIYQVQLIKGRYLEETGRAGLAIDLLTQALPTARQSSQELYANALKYMALAQRRHGNNDSAIQYYERYVQVLDTLTKEKLSRTKADLLEARRQASQKEQQPAAPGQKGQDGKDNRLQVPERNNATPTRLSLFFILIAMGIVLLLLYLLFRNKEKATGLQNRQNDRIEALNVELALANETKVKLFSIIGRDLRSPASQIVHWLQLQKENPGLFDEESRRRHEEKVTTASEHILQTMEDLLLWSKSLRQHFTPQLTPTNLSAVVRKELNFLQQRIQEKGLRISTDIPDDFLPLTDESFASVIIRNLLQNAIRHSNEGSTISIRAGGSDLRITNPSPLTDTRALNALLHDRAMDGSSSGLGLKIANDLAAVIHTEIVFTRSADGYLTALLSWKN